MAKKKSKHKGNWWIHRERAMRAKRERIKSWHRGDDLFVTRTSADHEQKPGPLTVRYECPVCGGDHHRNDHDRGLEEAA